MSQYYPAGPTGASKQPRVTYRPETFRPVRRGSFKNVLGWTDAAGLGRTEPQFTPDNLFVICTAARPLEKALEAGKWVDIALDGDMAVRDGVCLVSPTAALLEVATLEIGAHIVLPGQHVMSTVRIKPKERLDSLPPLLYVGVFK